MIKARTNDKAVIINVIIVSHFFAFISVPHQSSDLFPYGMISSATIDTVRDCGNV